MNVGFSPGGFGFGGPQGAMSTQDFQKELKNQTNEDLINMLGDPKLSPGAKLMIGKELEERMNAKGAEGAGGAGGGEEGDGDDLKKLLKKLQDGTISSEELKKLSGMLGVDVATLEKAKGKEGGQAGEGDILGG
ncbi:hypothetical protein [Pseudoduganella chitinolytica]|uniref:SHOCT domain-containing protein n=1 Tax=Pseudoduganella chitinolytica TaxID=34070 RepID=A0ABY8BCW7_9BURK|nr:hypothetical protein [Pseudoduganella chitinolytica]WEF32209.1 hypothetical protein PX653_22755 [Pseudoduganella chitinolytica]